MLQGEKLLREYTLASYFPVLGLRCLTSTTAPAKSSHSLASHKCWFKEHLSVPAYPEMLILGGRGQAQNSKCQYATQVILMRGHTATPEQVLGCLSLM